MSDELVAALDAGKSPGELGFFMPAETAPHAACWMAWPHDATSNAWQEELAQVQEAFVDISTAIAAFEPVRVVAQPERANEARAALPEPIDVVALAAADLWFRDTGPALLTARAGRHLGRRMPVHHLGGKLLAHHGAARGA